MKDFVRIGDELELALKNCIVQDLTVDDLDSRDEKKDIDWVSIYYESELINIDEYNEIVDTVEEHFETLEGYDITLTPHKKEGWLFMFDNVRFIDEE